MGLLLYILCVFSTGLLARYLLRLEDFSAFSLYRLSVSFFWGLLVHIAFLQIVQLLSLNPSHAQLRVFLMLVAAIMPLLMLGWFFRNRTVVSWKVPIDFYWCRLNYLGLGIIAIQLSVLLWITVVLPMIGWDGWAAWLVKSKVWYYTGLDAVFTNAFSWQSEQGVYSNLSAYYPDGFPLVHYAVALFAGWDETSFKILTWFMWLCFLPCFYHALRKLDVSQTMAFWSTVLLTCIPMFRYHVYSGGYVDLWLSIYLFLCFSAAQSFILKPDKYTFIRFLILLLALPLFKLEGMIWMLLVVATFALASLSSRNRVRVVVGSVLLLALWFVFDGFTFNTPFGLVQITPQLFQIGDYVNYALAFNDSSQALFEALFVSRNWLLIWYFLPLVIWLAFRYHKRSELLMLSVFLVLTVLFILGLFYLTGASKWAENFTSINRVVLHMVPVYLLLGSALLFQQMQERRIAKDSVETE
ncbi:hypothetical protein [Marinicella sp. W31]|uniref:hypothetical protein n=1 Tax=Marinicella sp. W31 TaxID=3023713 RepID=UPI003756938B